MAKLIWFVMMISTTRAIAILPESLISTAVPVNYADYLSTKSPYPNRTTADIPPAPPSCSTAQVHLIARHGTRYPTKSSISSMTSFASRIESLGDEIVHPAFRNLKIPYNISLAGELSDHGVVEMSQLAMRSKSRLASSGVLSLPDRVVVQASNLTRTIKSADAFTSALYGKSLPLLIFDRVQDADLRAHESCMNYDGHTLEGENWRTAKLPGIASRLSALIRSPDSTFELKADDVLTIVDICAYALALGGSMDICDVLTREDLEVFEIGEDLDLYYEFSRGSPSISKIMCSLLSGVWNQINNLVDTVNSPLAHGSPDNHFSAFLRFGHAESVMPLVAALGLYRDQVNLRANMSDYELAARKWVVSKIAPFASNVWIEAYSCDPDPATGLSFSDEIGADDAVTAAMPGLTPNNRIWIRILVNEEVVEVPGCDQGAPDAARTGRLCSYDRFMHLFGDIFGCDFDAQCSNTGHTFGGWNDYGFE